MDEAVRMAADVGQRVVVGDLNEREVGRCSVYSLNVLEIEDWVRELRTAHEDGVEPYHIEYPLRR